MSNPFDSHGDEFSSAFSSSVNESAELLKDNYESLLEMSNKINSPKDDAKFRQNIKTKIQFNIGLIKDTQKSIEKLYSLAKGQKDKTKMVDKYKEDFERFVQSFHQLNNSVTQKLESTSVASSSSHSSGKDGYYSNPKSGNPFDDDLESSENLLQRDKQMQQMSRFDIDAQDDLIQDRDREIKHIQGQMRDVNDIFKSLAQLVEEQSEIVDHIQVNISNANANVSAAVIDITDADKLQSGSNNKLCILAIIIIVILIVVVGGLVAYFTLRSSGNNNNSG
jgi:hypothetical protein